MSTTLDNPKQTHRTIAHPSPLERSLKHDEGIHAYPQNLLGAWHEQRGQCWNEKPTSILVGAVQASQNTMTLLTIH
ncbi:hypothetical protein KC361_g236 [Hortaea werneckii]|nr:hypothetical protein KC361_g236 [Hortaea werneckii]